MDKIGDFAFSCVGILLLLDHIQEAKDGGFFRAVSYWVSLGMESREGSAEDRVL